MRVGRRAARWAAVVAGIGVAAAAGLAVGVITAGGVGTAREHTTDEFRGPTFTAPPPGDPPA